MSNSHGNVFDETDVITQSIEAKMSIVCNQPNVQIKHSSPFPIALVEENTNIVFTKGLLLNHLFLSFESPCILCPLCKVFLTVSQFSKHLHDDIDDSLKYMKSKEDKTRRINEILKNKSFNILPYRTKNYQITENDLLVWKNFGKRYSEYKRDRSGKSKKDKKERRETSETKSEESEDVSAFLDWDYVTESRKYFLIANQSLLNENIVYLNSVGNQISFAELYKQHDNSDFNYDNVSIDQSDDLVLSEDEDIMAIDDIRLQKKEKIKTSIMKNSPTRKLRPSISTFFYNYFDNLSNESLIYLCDNQYTIIPSSLINFIVEKKLKNAKLINSKANLNYLDLHCKTFI
jgi:hypothetical protein